MHKEFTNNKLEEILNFKSEPKKKNRKKKKLKIFDFHKPENAIEVEEFDGNIV